MSRGLIDLAIQKLVGNDIQRKNIYRFDVTSNTNVAANGIVPWHTGYTSNDEVYLNSTGNEIHFAHDGRVEVDVHIIGNAPGGRLWCILNGGNYSVQGIQYGAYCTVDLHAVFAVTASTVLSLKMYEAFTLCSGGVGPCMFTVEYL